MATAKKKRKRQETDDVFIPDKLYFRIGEAAELAEVQPYVLRFWETEFPQLRPSKGTTGQRMYRRRDVETVLRIKQLLHEEGFTIMGAREKLRAEAKSSTQSPLPFVASSGNREGLRRVRTELMDLLRMLNHK